MMNLMFKLLEIDFDILDSLLIGGIMSVGFVNTLIVNVLEMISEREMFLFFHNGIY